jgi:PAS domain S-box-containing protein
MLGRRIAEVQAGPHAQEEELFRELLAHGKPIVQHETQHRRRDGSIAWMLLSAVPVRNARGEIIGSAGTASDISRRKAAEAARRKSEERFQIVASVTRDVIWDYDIPAETVWRNENYERCFGLIDERRDETVAAWRERIHSEDAERVSDSLDAAAAGTETLWSAEYRFRRADGSYAHVLDRAFLVRDATGKAIRMLGAMSDFSARVELENELRHAHKMESVGELAAGVGHEFNNLLTIIAGHVELLQRAGRLDPDSLKALRQVGKAADRAAHLTRQLLTFGRRQLMQLKRLNLNAAVETSVGLISHLITEPHKLALELCGEPLWIQADMGMIEHVVINLALNAREASPQGGMIHITTTLHDAAAGSGARRGRVGRFARLSVADCGAGMSAEIVSRIFEPFFSTRELHGTAGLGLATVHGIVTQHRGWIDVESAPGKGSAFHVYIPEASTSEGAPSEPANATLELRGGGETILVVEDEEALRELAVLVLRGEGYRVFEAATGPEALGLWTAHTGEIDLIFTDVLMPGGMSGKDLADECLRACPELPVIFTSGYSRDAMSKDLVLPEDLQFLPKPYLPDDLLKAIRTALDLAASRRGA